MVPWPKIDALRTFLINEVSIIGKTPPGRKLQLPDLCRLKIIESWIFHFSKQKRNTIVQAIWTLFTWYLFSKYYFWLNLVINNWGKNCLESFSKVNLMIPFLPKLTWTLLVAFFLNVDICLIDYSSPLNIENKDLAQFFCSFSFDLLQGTAIIDDASRFGNMCYTTMCNLELAKRA